MLIVRCLCCRVSFWIQGIRSSLGGNMQFSWCLYERTRDWCLSCSRWADFQGMCIHIFLAFPLFMLIDDYGCILCIALCYCILNFEGAEHAGVLERMSGHKYWHLILVGKLSFTHASCCVCCYIYACLWWIHKFFFWDSQEDTMSETEQIWDLQDQLLQAQVKILWRIQDNLSRMGYLGYGSLVKFPLKVQGSPW